MTVRHHPTAELLLGYASGSLGRGASLVVLSHLGSCPACKAEVARLEAVGGAMIEALPPAEMAHDALARALACIDSPSLPEPPSFPSKNGRAAPVPDGTGVADALADLPLGRQRWIAPGIWMRRVLKDGPGTAYLLRSGPREQLARHGHQGAEYVCVIKGAFSDETGHYGPGDFVASDESVVHSPMSDADGECLCLIYAEGPMRMRSLVGAMMQPIVGL